MSNVITNIDPTKTPFLSSIKTESVDNTLYEWQEDHLDAPAMNAQPEGAAAPQADYQPTVMRNNRTQILTKAVQVSGTADRVATYGRKKELGYQLAKKGQEIKRDLETSLIGTGQIASAGADVSGSNAAVARTFSGFQAMIDPGNIFVAGTGIGVSATVPSGSSTAVGAGSSPVTLTEDMVLATNEQLYAVGGEASILMIRPKDAIAVANFAFRQSTAGAVERQVLVNNGTKKVTMAVDLYESPFGTQKVVMNRWLRQGDALLFDPAMWKQAVLRPWQKKDLAITGDNTPVMLLGEFGLKHSNYKASAYITNLAN